MEAYPYPNLALRFGYRPLTKKVVIDKLLALQADTWKREQEAKGQQFAGGTGDPPALT